MRICNENKIYMKYSLFWWLNFGTLKQFMMTMPFLTSIQLCLNSLYSDLHLKILLLFVGNQLKAEKVRLAISPLPLQQSKIWLKWSAAGRRPANLRKRNFLVSVNTTDFEKHTIQAHSALVEAGGRRSPGRGRGGPSAWGPAPSPSSPRWPRSPTAAPSSAGSATGTGPSGLLPWCGFA